MYIHMYCGVFFWMNVVWMKLSAVWDDCYGHRNIWLNFKYHVLLFLLVGYYQIIRSCSWGPEPSLLL